MKIYFNFLLISAFSIFLSSCEKEELNKEAEQSSISSATLKSTEKTLYLYYGSVISIRSPHTDRYVTGAWAAFNYDAWYVTTSVGAYEKFVVVDPSNPSSTSQVLTGSVIALKNQVTGRYLVRESDGDVNCDRTTIGAWEKWQLFALGNTISGYGIAPGGQPLHLRSDAGPYLNYNGVYDAKATGVFNSNTAPVNNPNCIDLQLYL